jgi:carbon monoxide dehydrogenase subunit G
VIRINRTFTVGKPAPEVIDYLKDFARAEEWDPGTVSCKRIDAGPVRVGSTWHNVSAIRGRETELLYRLARLEPDRVTFVGTNKTATSTDDMTISARGEDTEISYTATIIFNGLAKVAGPFLARTFDKLGDETQQQMTKAINDRT